MSTATLTKWGNSQGVIIPKPLAHEAGLALGDTVDLSVKEGNIIISPVVRRTTKVTMDELLETWNGTYEPPDDYPTIGNEIDWGEPSENEVW